MPESGQIEVQQGNSGSRRELLPPDTREQRLANWRIMAARVAEVKDGLGRPIDAGIVEPVIALNLLGVNTTQSCEGHTTNEEHGKAYPWIDVGRSTEEIDQLYEVAKQASRRNREGATQEDQNAAFIELRDVSDKIRELSMKSTLEESKKLLELLDEFYHGRKGSIKQHLIVTYIPDGSAARLQPQGAELQEINDLEDRDALLRVYKQEMADFSAFLKNKYVGE
jgi:hypothetical protein